MSSWLFQQSFDGSFNANSNFEKDFEEVEQQLISFVKLRNG
jgi:hypothetical protein